jgi:MFS family permease
METIQPTQKRSFYDVVLFYPYHALASFTDSSSSRCYLYSAEFNYQVCPQSPALPSSGAAQLPSGWLADRIGPTILITIGILGVAVGGMFVGLSQTYIMLIIAMIFMGLMAGGYHPASTPLISLSVPVKQRGRALGLHLIGGNSSFFLAPLIAGGIAAAWGWRGAYVTLAIPTAIIGVFFYIYLSRRYGKAHMEEMKRKQIEETPPQPGYKRRLWAFSS